MRVICISGKAGSGKDYTADLIKELLEGSRHRKVLIVHYGDLLKYLCKSLFNWNGEKDEAGRTLLQHVGTEVVREKDPDYWVKFLLGVLDMFQDEWDYVLIPDCRFPNEIDEMKKFEYRSVRVTRPDYDNGLTEEQKNHVSETALDDYRFDFEIFNDGDPDNYRKTVEELCNFL